MKLFSISYELDKRVRRTLVSFSSALKWSSLATMGDSYIIRLTIIVPFLGYVLIYNGYIFDFLNFPREYLHQAGDLNSNKNFTLTRLNYIYFGLTFLGLASAAFAIFSPKEIAKNRSAVGYVQYMNPIKTNNVVRSSLTTVLEFYRSINSEDIFHKKSNIYYPYSINQKIHLLVEEIYGASEQESDVLSKIDSKFPSSSAVEQFDQTDHANEYEFDYELLNMSGQLQTVVLVERALHGGAAFRYFEGLIFYGATRFSNDVFFLEHIVLDYSSFWLRSLVGVLYAFGFFLLFIPTLMTSYLLIVRWTFI